MGVGLSIVNDIVAAHQGTVEVDSTVGKGSRFTVTLPANGGGGSGAPG
jgi:signal transduction histidine kinase